MSLAGISLDQTGGFRQYSDLPPEVGGTVKSGWERMGFRTTMDDRDRLLSKVPAITLGFWIIKILATTLGETGGDTVSMTWLGETTPEAGQSGLNGYLVGTAIFGI